MSRRKVLCTLWFLMVIAVTYQQDLTQRCNVTVTSIENMLNMYSSQSSEDIGPEFVMCVNMVYSEEMLRYSNMTVPFSVVIRPGVGLERCTLTCESEPSFPLTDYERFPLIIYGSEFVRIENMDFTDCIRPVQMLWIGEIQLVNTTFSNFSQGGALEVSNSPLVLVDSCQFTNNTSEGIGTTRYSGNSGGLSIGFADNVTPQNTTPQINITQTQFIRNRADAKPAFRYDISHVLREQVYNQRGGALAVYAGTPNYSVEINIDNCVFEKNWARDSGGGVYINIRGLNNSHMVLVTDTDFIENFGPDGGGLEITQYSFSEPHHTVIVRNSRFLGNIGNFGGGFKSFQVFVFLNSVNMYNCTFMNNTATVGAALYMQSVFTVGTETIRERSTVQDCTFESNSGKRGTVFFVQNSVGFRGTTVFRNNTGPALRISQCLVSLGGDILFTENHAHPEGFSGALYFSQFGQVLLKSGVNITFTNNTGNEGACIVVKSQLVSAGFPQQLYNPQCFLQYEFPTLSTEEWNVTMLFEGNRAVLGPIVYASKLDPCQWYSQSKPFFSLNITIIWGFMDMRDNYISHDGVDSVSPEDYIQTIVHSLEISTPNTTVVAAPPGTSVTLDVAALDQFGRNTSAFIELLNDEDIADNVEFVPTIAQTVAGVGQIRFEYESANLTGETDMILRASFLNTENIPDASLILKHELCLPGYNFTGLRCECIEGTTTVLFCLPNQKGILLADGLWGAPPNWSRTLVTHTCPSGYCDCSGDTDFQESEGCPLLFESPNEICDDTREGFLCGQCKTGMGVGLLTNMCREYTDPIAQAYWLLPIYLVVLVVVLVLIVRLGVHLHPIFRGLLFYVQVSSVAVAYLPASFRLRVDVMDCIWSGTSLYLPYDFSFHAGLTSLESYGLEYLPPVVALIVVPAAARLGNTHSRHWHGVWTVIFLVYARAVDTSISLLHCPTLTGTLPSGALDTITRWFFDGSVKCFQGAHVFLGIVAILTLLILFLLIPVTALIIYHRKIKREYPPPERVEKLTVAITKGFKEKYKWWPVMELSRRFIFIIVVSLTPGSTFVPLIFSLILLVLQMATQPYKNELANALETFALFWLVVLLALGNTTPVIIASKNLENFTLWPVFFLPVAVGGVVFTSFIIFKIGRWCKLKAKKRFQTEKPKSERQSRFQKFTGSLSLSGYNMRVRRARHYTTTEVGLEKEDNDFEIIDNNVDLSFQMVDTSKIPDLNHPLVN